MLIFRRVERNSNNNHSLQPKCWMRKRLEFVPNLPASILLWPSLVSGTFEENELQISTISMSDFSNPPKKSRPQNIPNPHHHHVEWSLYAAKLPINCHLWSSKGSWPQNCQIHPIVRLLRKLIRVKRSVCINIYYMYLYIMSILRIVALTYNKPSSKCLFTISPPQPMTSVNTSSTTFKRPQFRSYHAGKVSYSSASILHIPILPLKVAKVQQGNWKDGMKTVVILNQYMMVWCAFHHLSSA